MGAGGRRCGYRRSYKRHVGVRKIRGIINGPSGRDDGGKPGAEVICVEKMGFRDADPGEGKESDSERPGGRSRSQPGSLGDLFVELNVMSLVF